LAAVVVNVTVVLLQTDDDITLPIVTSPFKVPPEQVIDPDDDTDVQLIDPDVVTFPVKVDVPVTLRLLLHVTAPVNVDVLLTDKVPVTSKSSA